METFKMILILVIFLLTSTMGFIYGNFYKRRRQNLYDLQCCIRLLKSEILIKNTPLPQALKSINEKKQQGIYNIFFQIGMDLEQGRGDDVFINFHSKKEMLKDKLSFKPEDIEVFLFLATVLGQSNRFDQDKNLSFIIQQINELSIQASIEEEKNKKLYPSLGVLIGMGMIIILI